MLSMLCTTIHFCKQFWLMKHHISNFSKQSIPKRYLIRHIVNFCAETTPSQTISNLKNSPIIITIISYADSVKICSFTVVIWVIVGVIAPNLSLFNIYIKKVKITFLAEAENMYLFSGTDLEITVISN